METSCQQIKKDGYPCKAKALRGDTSCIMHSQNPFVAEVRESARRLGGLNSRPQRIKSPLQRLRLGTIGDVIEVARTAINEARAGVISSHTANAVAILLRVVLDTYQIVEKIPIESNAVQEPERRITVDELDKIFEEYQQTRGIMLEYEAHKRGLADADNAEI